MGQIKVHFIGHSDSAAVSQRPNDIIKSNFTLSSLRAASALEYAISQGLPSDRLFTEGAANNSGSSRSLSLRIESY